MVSAQARVWLLFPGRIISIYLILNEKHPLKLIALPDLGNLKCAEGTWEALSAGDPAAKRGQKKHYG
jgi:hypothetical protein